MPRLGEPSYSGGVHVNYTGPGQEEAVAEPSTPCPYLPGTRDKVFFLQARVEAGEQLWHKDDQVSWDEESDVPWFVNEEMLEELMGGDDES